jgi:hypothetical protein
MIQPIRIVRIMFSDKELLEIASGQPLEAYMSPKQISEFYSLNEKEIYQYWLNVKSVKELFDGWIQGLPASSAITKVAKYAITEWAKTIVDNHYMGYSDDEAMDIAAAADRVNRNLRRSMGPDWREEMRCEYGLQ